MIIPKSAYNISSWSGGTSTQLFIYPPDSSYQERNFEIRISSATVDVEESVFTKLLAYKRVLMILSGQLEITHQGEYSKVLKQYECDYFDGAWNTTAKGKVVDFNLMTSKNLTGDLFYETLLPKTEISLHKSSNQLISGLYLISGKLQNKDNRQIIHPQELIILQNDGEDYQLTVLEECQVIKIEVKN